MLDDFLERALREIATRHERIGEAGGEAERHEVGLRVVRQVAVQARRESEVGGGAEEQRVAIRLGLRHRLGADDRAAARPVLHDHRLAEQRAERLGERPRREVEAAARWLRHDHAQWLGRKRLSRNAAHRRCEGRGEEAGEQDVPRHSAGRGIASPARSSGSGIQTTDSSTA